jgi:hypothetical protein
MQKVLSSWFLKRQMTIGGLPIAATAATVAMKIEDSLIVAMIAGIFCDDSLGLEVCLGCLSNLES